jgi:hypothetical protein
LDQNIKDNIYTYNKVKRAVEKLSVREFHSSNTSLQGQSTGRPRGTIVKDDKGIKYFRLGN